MQTLRLILLSLSNSGIKEAENMNHKYETEYKIYLPYMIQTGFCKWMKKSGNLKKLLLKKIMCSKVF